jgi:propionyl-CoA synthetase
LIPGHDYDWHAVQDGVTPADCLPVEGNHPSFIYIPPALPVPQKE